MNKPLEWTTDHLVSDEENTLDTQRPHERNQTDDKTLLKDILYYQQCMLTNIFVTL